MFKKYVKLIITLVGLGAILFAIVKEPKLILDDDMQNKLIEASGNIDDSLDSLFLTGDSE